MKYYLKVNNYNYYEVEVKSDKFNRHIHRPVYITCLLKNMLIIKLAAYLGPQAINSGISSNSCSMDSHDEDNDKNNNKCNNSNNNNTVFWHPVAHLLFIPVIY